VSGEPTYNDFHLRVDKTYNVVKNEQRFGQYYFNCLHSLRPDLADRIRGNKLDPFYRDNVPAETMKFVAENW
jgi:hypothetical protein